MTTVLKDPSGEVIVFTKGADSVLFPLCGPEQEELKKKTQIFMDDYAKEGLRTLLLV
jgi:phospholipid-transporting ATPase